MMIIIGNIIASVSSTVPDKDDHIMRMLTLHQSSGHVGTCTVVVGQQ